MPIIHGRACGRLANKEKRCIRLFLGRSMKGLVYLISLAVAKCNQVSSGEAKSQDAWFVHPAGREAKGRDTRMNY